MPFTHDNPPNLTALAYRLGTHPTILRGMLERLHTQPIPPGDQPGRQRRPLADLTTRDADDPAIALLDAWAVVADVLTFYQERIANEGYLRTATEYRSVLELARMTGYEPRPGLAASVSLAFTVETTPGMDALVRLEPGIKIQSIPGQDQLPQVFETVEAIAARPEWNMLRPYIPRIVIPQIVTVMSTQLRLAGTGTGLLPGDRILVLDNAGGQPAAGYIALLQTVTPDPAGASTLVTWEQPLAPAHATRLAQPRVFALRQKAALFGRNAPRLPDVPADRRPVRGGVYRYTSQNTSQNGWTQIQSGLPHMAVTGLATYTQKPSSLLFAATAGAGVFRSTDSGASWKPCNSGLSNLTVQALFADERQHLFAATADGAIFRSLDDGASWAQVWSGSAIEHITYFKEDGKTAILVKGDGEITTDTTEGVPKEEWRSLGLTKSVQALGGYKQSDTEFHLLVATDDGIYKSTNDVSSWTRIEERNGVRALVAQGSTLYLGTRAGLYSSGARIGDLTDFWGLAVQPALPGAVQPASSDILWATAGGQIVSLKLKDAGAESPTVIANLPNNDVRALAIDAQGQIFAAFALGDQPDWPNLTLRSDARGVDLDNIYSTIVAGVWVALIDPSARRAHAYRVAGASITPRDEFTLSGRVTHLDFEAALSEFDGASARGIEVMIQGAELALYEQTGPLVGPITPDMVAIDRRTPVAEPVGQHAILVDQRVPELNSGRRIIVSGRLADSPQPDTIASEIAFVEAMAADVQAGYCVIALRAPGLQHSYDRNTVTIQANVVLATHGETVNDEVLGSGDGVQINQRFYLKHAPLTYVPAPTDSGARGTLSVRVNELLWDEAPELHELGTRSQSYIARQDSAGRTYIVFGDGVRGARLPSGMENVVASYRSGIGLAGNVNANSLTLLQTRPLGVQEVDNPLPASGGADPEPRDMARKSAPLRVLTMDRIVSLSDFEDFAGTFAGISMAQATLLSAPRARPVHITVAGSQGSLIPADSALYQNLVDAIDQRRNRLQPVLVASYERVNFNLEARVFVHPRYQPAAVEDAVKTALVKAFSFERRSFGQDIARSQVIAVIQGVPGVVAVDLDRLYLDPPKSGGVQSGGAQEWTGGLRAYQARWDAGSNAARPAVLLVIQPEQAIKLLMEMTS